MTATPATAMTLDAFIAWLGGRKPRDMPNLERTLRLILPALAARHLGIAADDVTDEQLARFRDTAAANVLQDFLVPGGRRWASWLLEAVPVLGKVKAYKDDYRRCFARCIKHGIASRVLSRAAVGVSDAWQVYRDQVTADRPYNGKQTAAHLAKGMTTFRGKDLRQDAVAAQRLARRELDAANLFGRHMTSIGILLPEQLTDPKKIYGDGDSFYAALKRQNPDGMHRYYDARIPWEKFRARHPELDLAPWPTPGKDREIYLRPERRPALFNALLQELRDTIRLQPDTVNRIEATVLRFAGYLADTLRVDLDHTCAGLDSAIDLAWLLFAPYPLPADGKDPSIEAEIARIQDNSPERRQLLLEAGVGVRKHRGAWPSRANPFVKRFLAWTLARGRTGNAEMYVNSIKSLSKRYLQADESQLGWLKEERSEVRRKAKNRPPTSRTLQRAALGKDRRLWAKLVAARDRLSAYTRDLRARMDAEPENAFLAMRWATALRDEVLISYLLAFGIRSRNVIKMEIGTQMAADASILHLLGHTMKADTELYRSLPDDGPFADLKGLLLRYLRDARPIILADRADTPYVFVTNPKEADVSDDKGNLIGGRQAVAQVVRKISKRHFSDLLPEGLDALSPHLFRHLFANFAAAVTGAPVVAAISLQATLEIIKKHYESHQIAQDEKVWTIVNGALAVDEAETGLRKRVEGLLGNPLSEGKFRALCRAMRPAR